MNRRVVFAAVAVAVLLMGTISANAQQGAGLGLLTVGPDNLAYYIANDTLWRWDPLSTSDAVELADYSDLAGRLGISAEQIEPIDLAVTDDGAVWLSLAGRGELLLVSSGGTVSIAVTESQLTAVTGESTAQPGSLAIDTAGTLYVAEEQSGDVLAVTESGSAYTLDTYTAGAGFDSVVREAVLAALESGAVTPSTTTLAQTDGPFTPTALVGIEGSGLYGDGYYITQFSPSGSIEGDGAVARIVPNENDPAAAVWQKLFDPDLAEPNVVQDAFHPTALALAGAANAGFGEKLYMANFGASFGPDMDGRVFVVEPDGTLTEFVTEYVDDAGQPVEFSGVPVTGFYDVIDIDFSPAGASAFGNYLYILSENGQGSGGGGKLSDVWRIDSSGSAELFVEDVADSVGSLTFDTVGTFDNDLLVATWATAEIFRVDEVGNTTAFHEFAGNHLLDMVVAPSDSIFAGELLVTVSDTGTRLTRIISIAADGTETVWATGLDAGAVPGVDFALDDRNNVVMLLESDDGISRVEFDDLFDQDLHTLQVRPDNGTETPYILLATQGEPYLVRLAQTETAEGLFVEAGPEVLGAFIGPENTEGFLPIAFDGGGDLYVYSQNDGSINSADRNDGSGLFDSFSTYRTGPVIDGVFGGQDVTLIDLAWGQSSFLLGQADDSVVELIAQQASTKGKLAVGPDDMAYFAQASAIWRFDPEATDAEESTKQIATYAQLAAAIGVSATDLEVLDLTVKPDETVWVTTNAAGDVLKIDTDGRVSIGVLEDDLATQTEEASARASRLTSDDNGLLYLVDEVSGGILTAAETPDEEDDSSIVNVFVPGERLSQSLTNPTIARVEDDEVFFQPTSLVRIIDSTIYSDGYYLAHFGDGSGDEVEGDGAIVYVVPNEADPEAAVFTTLFDPDDATEELAEAAFHPTALALASQANTGFANKLYMGNFGVDLGTELDGKVFVVEPDGTLSEFVTSYVDPNGDEVIFGGEEVTGFYDVIDMAFSPAGGSAFGNYLYVLSENGQGSGGAGKLSDIWRIDSTGRAELFLEDVADSAGSLAFDTTGTFDGVLLVVTWNTGAIYRINSDGEIIDTNDEGDPTSFHQISGATVLDMTVTAADSQFAGDALLSVTLNNETQIVSVSPRGKQTVWADGLDAGAIPGGDFVFDDDGEDIILLYEGDRGLRRITFDTSLRHTIDDLQFRPEGRGQVLYAVLASPGQNQLVRLTAGGTLDNIRTEVEPEILDGFVTTTNDHLPFTFGDDGRVFVYSSIDGDVRRSPRDNDNGVFAGFTAMQLTGVIAGAFDTQSVAVIGVEWTGNGHFLVQAEDGQVASLSSRLEVSRDNSPFTLRTSAGRTLRLSVTGAGRSSLFLLQDDDGEVLDMFDLTLSGANLASTLRFEGSSELDNAAIDLESLTFDSSLRELVCQGTVGQLINKSQQQCFVIDAELGNVAAVDTPRVWFQNFQADNLGSDSAASDFLAAGLTNIDVADDVRNMTFLGRTSRNFYLDVLVGGVVENSTFHGATIQQFTVENSDANDIAWDNSSVLMYYGIVNQFTVERGDVSGGTVFGASGVREVEVLDGSLLGTTIDGTRYVGLVYASEQMDSSTRIGAASAVGMVLDISAGGNCNASITSQIIFRVRAGYTRQGARRDEEQIDDFDGGDFGGSVSSRYTVNEINATGRIVNASVSVSLGSISSVFAEDGLENTTLSAAFRVERIMVGYLNGNRAAIVNEEADVSGGVNASFLGRLYYTGQLDNDFGLPSWVGPVYDDVP